MRKRAVILLAFLLCAVLSRAENVSPERAAAAAESFFASVSTKSAASPVTLVATFPDIPTKARGEMPALYVFESPSGGYVIISGDDVAVPVTGYSRTGRFPRDNMPDNMRSLIEWHAAIIQYARARGWEADLQAREGWGRISASSSSSDKVVLETAKWGQWTPYNDLCPTENGQKCPSGCVATAMAIILRYYQYPDKGVGTLPGYDYAWDETKGKFLYHLDGYDLGHEYRWDLMPLQYNSGNYTQEEAGQVAQLMYDLGIMSQMDYAPGGSGAPGDSPILLTQFFGYDRQMRYLDRQSFSDRRWEQLIRDEIDAGRPVFHCGFSEQGGHAFVIDGYEGDYFSINYGWEDGSQFYLLTPPVKGNSSRLTEFTDWQDMVTNIQPDQGGEGYTNLYVPVYYTPFTWDFNSKSFQMPEAYVYLYYLSTGEEDVEVCYVLFDKEESFKEAISEPVLFNVSDGVVPPVNCRILGKIEDGDRIMLARREGKSWEPLPQTRVSFHVFDRTRRLPEMVTVGHSFESQVGKLKKSPCLYWEAYKDIWWEIVSEETGEVVASAKDWNVQDFDDSKADTFKYRFFLPAGSYKVTFRNFDEELVFRVTL